MVVELSAMVDVLTLNLQLHTGRRTRSGTTFSPWDVDEKHTVPVDMRDLLKEALREQDALSNGDDLSDGSAPAARDSCGRFGGGSSISDGYTSKKPRTADEALKKLWSGTFDPCAMEVAHMGSNGRKDSNPIEPAPVAGRCVSEGNRDLQDPADGRWPDGLEWEPMDGVEAAPAQALGCEEPGVGSVQFIEDGGLLEGGSASKVSNGSWRVESEVDTLTCREASVDKGKGKSVDKGRSPVSCSKESPCISRKKPMSSKQKERLKAHKVAKRAEDRRKQQAIVGSDLKAVVRKRLARYQNHGTEVNGRTLPHAQSGYIGVGGRTPSHSSRGLNELIEDGFQYIPWTGMTGVGLLDVENRLVVGGVGLSYGNGQPRPMRLSNSIHHLPALEALMDDEAFRRIVGFQASLFRSFAPELAKEYDDMLEKLKKAHPELERNYPNNDFSTLTINFGPQTVSLPHKDFKNLSYGLCAITALGDFDPDAGGHLVLWDLRVVIRFPPGSTLLIPSALIRHSNTSIGAGERRYSVAQYSAGGLFRWVDNGFCPDAHYDNCGEDPVDNHTQPDNGDHVADTPEAAEQHDEGVELEEEEEQPEHMYCSAFFYVGKDRSRRENLVSMASPFHLVSFDGVANIYPGYAMHRIVDLRMKGACIDTYSTLDDAIDAHNEFCFEHHPHYDHFGDRNFRESLTARMEGLPYIGHDVDGDAMDTDDSTLCDDTPTPESGSAGDPGSNTPTDMEQEDTNGVAQEGRTPQYLLRIEPARSLVFSSQEAALHFHKRWEEFYPPADFIVLHGKIQDGPVSLLRDTSIAKHFYGVRGHKNHALCEDADVAQSMFDAEAKRTEFAVMVITPDAEIACEWVVKSLQA
ncbi:hypothetical protein EYR38_002025 [Pleurotus pulmonarius]|nr:hypothetical protein EYR38_002025 [Pleurotus pulmonarius]